MSHWRQISITNLIERINTELKRRNRPVEAFPRDKSLMRLAGCIMININEEWITSKRYLSLSTEGIKNSTGRLRNYSNFGTLPVI
jgi:putative transposase